MDNVESQGITPSTPRPAPRQRNGWVTAILIVVGLLVVVVFLGIQFIPVNETNPAVTVQIKWDSPQTEALARRACMDCHSDETAWPWYSRVAPVSWLTYYDIVQGRSRLNFSTLAGNPSQGTGNLFNTHSGDLAYQIGQMLAGGGQGGEGFRGQGSQGDFPNRQFPTPAPGQQAPGEGFPRGGYGGGRIDDVGEQIRNGNKPPAKYLLLHPTAKLTSAEQQELIQGLLKTFGQSNP